MLSCILIVGLMLVEANGLSWIFRRSAPKLETFITGNIGGVRVHIVAAATLLLFTWFVCRKRESLLQNFQQFKYQNTVSFAKKREMTGRKHQVR
jgi:hypothetical protein